MRPTIPIDSALLQQLWYDKRVRTCEIAERFGVSSNHVYRAAAELRLPPRGLPPGGIRDVPLPDLVDDNEVEPLDDTPGVDSLALDPWVARRARVVREQFAAARGARMEFDE